MAKTPTEQIREIHTDVVKLNERVQAIKDEITRVDLVKVLERIAVVENQLAELKKRDEERDRRSWQFWLGVGVVVLTFAANLTINLILFLARKPA